MKRWMHWTTFSLVLLFVFSVSTTPTVAQTVDAPEKPIVKKQQDGERKTRKKKKANDEFKKFMRIRRNGKRKPVAMETSVTRFIGENENGEKVIVDLIGVVHIGEKSYYERLNEEFEKYDGLLYELVAPEGTVIPKGGRKAAEETGGSMNPIAAMQVGMQSALGLEFQLDHIDYTKGNFIHADMSPEEFAESMKNNDESVFKIMLKAMGQSMSRPSSMSELDLLGAFFSKNKEAKMRQLFAEQMQDMEGGMAIFEGKEGSTIINHRNTKCMEILRREMNDGKKQMAIFYGAGHLPDMQRILTSDFKMKRGGQYWLKAWDLAGKKAKPKAKK